MESNSAGYTTKNNSKNEMPVPQGRIFLLAEASPFFWQLDKMDQRVSKFILILSDRMKASSLLPIDR